MRNLENLDVPAIERDDLPKEIEMHRSKEHNWLEIARLLFGGIMLLIFGATVIIGLLLPDVQEDALDVVLTIEASILGAMVIFYFTVSERRK